MKNIKIKRNKKSQRLNLYIEPEVKQHLYNASEHTGTAAAQIIREALRKELDEKYKSYKPDKDKPL